MPTVSNPTTKGDFVTLEKHIESRIAAVQDTIKAAYPDRTELLGLLEKINSRITCLEISKATLEGKASQRDVFKAEVMGGIGLVIAVVSLILSITR